MAGNSGVNGQTERLAEALCAKAGRPLVDLLVMTLPWAEVGCYSWERRYRPSPSFTYRDAPPAVATPPLSSFRVIRHY